MAIIYRRTADITADTDWELPPLDGSHLRAVTMHITMGAPTGAGTDLLDIYLQSRDQSGVWIDRAHSPQYLGDGGAQDDLYTIVSWPPLSPDEEAGTPPGPTTGSRLTADSVRHGTFPSIYYADQPNPGGQSGIFSPAANLRVSFDKGGAGSPSFPVTIQIDAIEEHPG